MIKKALAIILICIFSTQISLTLELQDSDKKREITNQASSSTQAFSNEKKNDSDKQEQKEMYEIKGFVYIYPSLIDEYDNVCIVMFDTYINNKASKNTRKVMTNNWYSQGYNDGKIEIDSGCLPKMVNISYFKNGQSFKRNGDIINLLCDLDKNTTIKITLTIDQSAYHLPTDPILEKSENLLHYLTNLTDFLKKKKKRRLSNYYDNLQAYKKGLINLITNYK